MLTDIKKRVRSLEWPILVLLLFVPLFFYNLGTFSLADFDEAWYADMARNILINRQPFLLEFNRLPFTGHPPLGMILIAVSFMLFGVSEWSARLPSAVLGFGSVVLTYLIGKAIYNRIVGFAASLILLSCVWFIFRARSANLDTIFLFFFLFTLYAVHQTIKHPRWLQAVAIGLGTTLSIKSVLGVTLIIPVFLFLFLKKAKVNFSTCCLSLGLLILLILPWMVANVKTHGNFYFFQMILTGTRSEGLTIPNIGELLNSQTLAYLNYGIGKWYKPGILAFLLSIFLLKAKPQLVTIVSITMILLFIFVTNQKTEIWHLIPLYPLLGLLLASVSYAFYKHIITLLTRLIKKTRWKTSINNVYPSFAGLSASGGSKQPKAGYTDTNSIAGGIFATRLSQGLFLLPFITIALWQIYQFRGAVKLFDSGTSDLAYVAKKAKNSDLPLYLGTDNMLPSAVFYAERNVLHVPGLYLTLPGLMEHAPRPFLVLTEGWRLKVDTFTKDAYSVKETRGDWVLLEAD